MDSSELKSCPFCGGNAKIQRDGTWTDQTPIYSVYCQDCRAESYWYESEEEAVAAWNKRVERTCTLCETGEESLRCSYCGNLVGWVGFCGRPTHCPNCKAKVVGE